MWSMNNSTMDSPIEALTNPPFCVEERKDVIAMRANRTIQRQFSDS